MILKRFLALAIVLFILPSVFATLPPPLICNGTLYVADAIITGCTHSDYQVGSFIQVEGSVIPTPPLPDNSTVQLEFMLDGPDLHNVAWAMLDNVTPYPLGMYSFTFSVPALVSGNYTLTILTPMMGHNALILSVPVSQVIPEFPLAAPVVLMLSLGAVMLVQRRKRA